MQYYYTNQQLEPNEHNLLMLYCFNQHISVVTIVKILPEFTQTISPGLCKNLYKGTFAASKSSTNGHQDPCK